MATVSTIHPLIPIRHVQGEAHTHLLVTKSGKSVGGKGYGCWFWPVGTAISEIPLNDQNVSLTLRGRTKDFQEVTVTAQAWFTVVDAAQVASRFDFSVDVDKGEYNADPLTVINGALVSAAQAAVWDYIAGLELADLLSEGLADLGVQVSGALSNLDFGVEVGRVSIMQVRPDTKIEQALQAETREALQMKADAAGFSRRATATSQERAIEEANLTNQLELAKQRTAVIEINDTNARREAAANVESARIKSEGEIAVTTRKAEALLAQRVKEAAENLRLEEALGASRLASRVQTDAQDVLNKAELARVTNEAEATRVALLSTAEGQSAAASIARIGLPTALANVRVLGGESLQLVLNELE